MDNPIRSRRGTRKTLNSEDVLTKLLGPIEKEAEDKVRGALWRQLRIAMDFLETPSVEALRVCVFNSNIESRHTADLTKLLHRLSRRRPFPLYTLMTTAKSVRKDRLYREVKATFADQDTLGVVFIENFEEWEGGFLSDFIEFLVESSHLEVGLIVELPGDLSRLNLGLRFDVAQKLIVDSQHIESFRSKTSEILLHLTKSPKLPLLSRELFSDLLQMQTKEDFFYLLKASFLNAGDLSWAKDNPQQQQLRQLKQQWFKALKRLVKFMRPLQETTELQLFIETYLAETVERSFTVKSLHFDMKHYKNTREQWEEWLYDAGLFDTEELDELFEQLEQLKVNQKSTDARKSFEMVKLEKWADVVAIPYLRQKLYKPIEDCQKKLSRLMTYPLIEKSQTYSPDVLGETVRMLLKPPEGLPVPDACVLFRLIAPQGIDLELNDLFTSFVNTIDEDGDLNELQHRFVVACNELARMGLLLKSNKRKADHLYLTKNVFGAATQLGTATQYTTS